MYEIAGRVIDYLDDGEALVLRENAGYLQKVAGDGVLLSPSATVRLPDRAFALVFTAPDGKTFRKLACHDRTHAALAGVYLVDRAHELPEECQKVAAYRILEAQLRHHLVPPSALMAMAKESGDGRFHLAELENPVPLDDERDEFIKDSEFLHVKVAEDGSVERMYRVTNEVQCHAALRRFETAYQDLEPVDRVKVATALKAKAEELAIPAKGAFIRKYASNQYHPNAKAYFILRAEYLEGKPERAIVEKLAEQIYQVPAMELGTALENLDKEAGLDAYWDKMIPDPYASVLGAPVERFRIGEKSLSYEEVAKLASDEELLGRVFGEEKIAAIKAAGPAGFLRLEEPLQEALVKIHEHRATA